MRGGWDGNRRAHQAHSSCRIWRPRTPSRGNFTLTLLQHTPWIISHNRLKPLSIYRLDFLLITLPSLLTLAFVLTIITSSNEIQAPSSNRPPPLPNLAVAIRRLWTTIKQVVREIYTALLPPNSKWHRKEKSERRYLTEDNVLQKACCSMPSWFGARRSQRAARRSAAEHTIH